MIRMTSLITALMLGGASVAWGAGVDRSASGQAGQTYGSAAGAGMTTDRAGSAPGHPGRTVQDPGGAVQPGQTAGAASVPTDLELRQRLEALGYTQVSEFEDMGDRFEARAQRDGRSVVVEIDAATGQVNEKQGKGRSPG